MGGDLNEAAAVVIWDEFHARRQCPVIVQFFDCGLDARQHVVGVQRAVHHHDGHHHVVIVILASDAEPRHVADRDLGDVLHLHRDAVKLGQHHVLDVLSPVALGQIFVAAAVQQADAANVDGLLANSDLAPAHIDVGIVQRRDELRKVDAVGVKLVKIDLDVVLLSRTTPRIDLNDTGHREQAARGDPGLHGTQVGQPEMWRTDHPVAIDLAGRARLLDLWNGVLRQRDVLLEVQARLGHREVVVYAVLEGESDEGQAVKRGRPDVLEARRRIKADFHRDRVVALHFLGGQAGSLGGDLEDHRRGVRIGLDVQPCESDQAGAEEHEQTQQHDRTAGQASRNDCLQH